VRCNSDLRVVLIHCSEHLLDKKVAGMMYRQKNLFSPWMSATA
jgi:hypothetical protein